MKTPVHHWKERVTYADGREPHWTFDDRPCWLGTGMSDRNGVEIFEGDRVKFGEHDNTGTVAFRNAMFVIDHDHSDKFTVLGNTAGFVDVEVVGHIAEEQQ